MSYSKKEPTLLVPKIKISHNKWQSPLIKIKTKRLLQKVKELQKSPMSSVLSLIRPSIWPKIIRVSKETL
jgi:hypothetical protein